MKRYVIPILTIVGGLAWLLGAIGFLPDVSWPWTLGLAGAGILCFALLGMNKLTFVVGLFLLVCSVFSLLRQTGRLELNTELPLLVIAFGLLLLLAEVLRLPRPDWIVDAESDSEPKATPQAAAARKEEGKHL